jgi:serine/threonine protein kinase
VEAAPDDDLTGSTVGKYAILALIGTGGQGRVYRARDQRLQREVALKVLSPDRRRHPAERRGLMNEARALSRLNHPHVASVYDFLTHSGRDFIVMELVAGATLRDVLAGSPLPTPEVVRLGAQLARGVAAAHTANLVHHDIKPANIKITSSGQLKVLDFGLARMMPRGAVDTASPSATDLAIVGTVPYMSPEQLRGDPPDHRSDIFSMGVVLYEMVAGWRAFPQRNLAELVEAVQFVTPPAPSRVNPLVPNALEAVIVQAMQKDARDRQQHALDIAEALDALTITRRRAVPARAPAAEWTAVAAAG